MAEGVGNDEFRWRDAWANGSEPGTERGPNEFREDDGEILKQSLSDDAGLDENMIGSDFAFDFVAIVLGLTMEILVAIAVEQRCHAFHPEMIGESPDLADSLFKTQFDFEAQAVEANNLGGAEREIGTHQDARAAGGVNNHDEADNPTDRAPEQIMYGIV